jgi:branched-chain amino acid transport system permease protein
VNIHFWQSIIDFSLIYGLFGIAVYVNLACGMLSLAAVPVGAVTGFLTAWLFGVTGMPVYVLLVVGLVVGVGVSAAMFELLRRISSHYLAMATLALVLVVEVIVLNLPEFTGGVSGRTVDFEVDTWLILAVAVIIALVMQRLRGSALWLSFSALRADVDVARGMGVNRTRTYRIAFYLSGGIAGVAGVLLAGALQYINPTTYGIPLVFAVLPAAVLGGTFHWVGPLVGAFLLEAIPAFFSDATTSLVQVIVGVLIFLIVLFLPGGVVSDSWVGLARRLGIRRRARAAVDEIAPAQGSAR